VTPPPSIGTVLSRIGETQAPLPALTVVLIGLAALATVGIQGTWLLARYADTVVHEGAHALAGSILGRKVQGVKLKRNGDGETRVSPGSTGGSILIGFVGYLGPSVCGLGAAKLIETGHSVAVLWLVLFLLILLLVVLREFFSFVPVLIVGGLIYLIARYTSLGAQIAASYGVAWFLLLSGVRKVIYRGTGAADAVALRQMTHIWRGFWFALWLTGTIVAVVVGGALLV
jgi:hypothetical protein